jgi:two-component system chemotaxis response regulator CheB
LLMALPAIVAIGASTGGPQVLELILTRLPPTTAGIVIVQHMPGRFTPLLAERLNSYSPLQVREAQGGETIAPGLVFIAPGVHHLRVQRRGVLPTAEVADDPLVNRHKPSVDVLFESVAAAAGARALGVLLTGMGSDGAKGLLAMHRAGARTIAQDQASCIVFGMPRAAIAIGAVDRVLTPEAIVGEIATFSP